MRKFIINVNGNSYEVEVEEVGAGQSAPAVSAPAAPAPAARPHAVPCKNRFRRIRRFTGLRPAKSSFPPLNSPLSTLHSQLLTVCVLLRIRSAAPPASAAETSTSPPAQITAIIPQSARSIISHVQ